jgi:hypothetical protein
VSLSQQRKAVYDALLYKKHPALYALYVHPGRPLVYYPIVISLMAMFAGGITRQPVTIYLAAATWLTCTSLFIAQRLQANSLSTRHVLEMVVTSGLIPPLSIFWRVRGGLRHRVPFW